MEKNELVSFEKMGKIYEDAVIKPIILITNKRGPRIEPCGTPQVSVTI